MIQWLAHITRNIVRFRRDEKGNATIEFVILFPMFIFVFLGAFESGIYMIRNVMLEHATEESVRKLRLRTANPPTFVEFKDMICSEAEIIPNCAGVLQVELARVSVETYQPLDRTPRCRDVSQPINVDLEDDWYNTGGENELMMVRVCAKFKPFFPGTGLGLKMKKADGYYFIIAMSAFVNEPSS